MFYLIFIICCWAGSSLGFLAGWLIAVRPGRAADRQDATTETAKWDAYVMQTMGGVWDPHTGHYVFPDREQHT